MPDESDPGSMPCGCYVEGKSIVFCMLHTAAPEMLSTLYGVVALFGQEEGPSSRHLKFYLLDANLVELRNRLKYANEAVKMAGGPPKDDGVRSFRALQCEGYAGQLADLRAEWCRNRDEAALRRELLRMLRTLGPPPAWKELGVTDPWPPPIE